MDNIASSPIQPTTTEASAPLQNAPVTAETPTSEAITIFETVHQMPYTAKHFGMTKGQYFALQQADITDLSPKMSAIDNYVRGKIQTEKYIDSTDTYGKIMDEIRSSLGIKDYETAAGQIEKIFLFITGGKAMARQYQVKRSSLADTRDHAKNQTLKDLATKYPNKSSRLSKLLTTFTQ